MPRSSSSTVGVMRGSMNISEPPPLRSAQARSETRIVCVRCSLFVAQGVEDQVGRHQLGQRRRVGARVGVALGQHLVGAEVDQQVLARRDLGRLRGLCEGREHAGRGEQESED
jgi:hypothetical protein